MKVLTIFLNPRAFVVVTLVLCAQLASTEIAVGQLPDCISGTQMYAVFSPIVPTNRFPTLGKDSTEIRAINFATGAVGPLMGGRRYYIRRNPGGGTAFGDYYYGSSGMAMDPITNKFYLVTQMGNGGDKDVVMIDPVAPTAFGTTIATIQTLSSRNMDDYHFVKAAASPGATPRGYTLGVHRQSNFTPTNRFNPLVRFPLCNTAGCANAGMILLGYLPTTLPSMVGWQVYNGDIAFDNAGNLYFLAAAFQTVGGTTRYTDARLFRINAADVPNTAGTGTIPMSFVADFNGLDSTGCSGICFGPTGNLYFTTRRYVNNANLNAGFTTELHASFDTTNSVMMGSFGPIPDSTSAGDLASCYFPGAILGDNKLDLSSSYFAGQAKLKWQVNDIKNVVKYEVQRSDDGVEYETIATIYPGSSTSYAYNDPQSGFDVNKYYRIRQTMANGMRWYSNVAKVRLNSKINLISAIQPNPFTDKVGFSIDLRTARMVTVKMVDQNGRIVRSEKFNLSAGNNKIAVNGLGNLNKGVYILEMSVEEEIIREKLIKQ